jgi:hypothetical protein
LTGRHENEPADDCRIKGRNVAQLPPIIMTPTTAELRTAIEVLKMLGQRLNDHAAHSVMQLPETELGDKYAGHIEARTIEQTSHIEKVAMQLQNWRDEMLKERKQHVSQSV